MVDKAIAFCFTATVIYRDTFKSFFWTNTKKSQWYFQINWIKCFCQRKRKKILFQHGSKVNWSCTDWPSFTSFKADLHALMKWPLVGVSEVVTRGCEQYDKWTILQWKTSNALSCFLSHYFVSWPCGSCCYFSARFKLSGLPGHFLLSLGTSKATKVFTHCPLELNV